MATVPTRPLKTSRGPWWVVVLLAALPAGCVSSGMNFLWPGEGQAASGAACQVVATWQNNVLQVPDSTKGGQLMPGFAGRVYLFGSNIDFPVVAEGSLIVDLVDETYDPATWVERWNIDAETFQRLMKKDIIGCGYTIFLPSKEYRPEMTKVRLRTCFQPVKGAPIYTENVVTLAATNGVIREGKPIRRPGAHVAPPAAQSPVVPKVTLPMPQPGQGPALPPPTPVR